MAEGLFEFLRKHFGNVGMVGIILTVLEKIMEDDFVCPCEWKYNIVICVLYAAVPFFACLLYSAYFMDLKSSNTQDRGTEDNPSINNRNESTLQSVQSQDRGTENISMFKKIFYSLLTGCIWLCIFFADGRYFACAFSTWGGIYTKNESFGILKWCKPIGNETLELYSQQETLKWMCRSQVSSQLNTVNTQIIL